MKLSRFLCYYGFHNWQEIAGTRRWIDKWTIEAKIHCVRCGRYTYGQKPSD